VRPGKTSAILHSVNYASKSGVAEGEPTLFVRIIPGIMYLGAVLLECSGGKAMKSFWKRRLATDGYVDSRQQRERCASYLGGIL
jgi:hypothetical protein